MLHQVVEIICALPTLRTCCLFFDVLRIYFVSLLRFRFGLLSTSLALWMHDNAASYPLGAIERARFAMDRRPGGAVSRTLGLLLEKWNNGMSVQWQGRLDGIWSTAREFGHIVVHHIRFAGFLLCLGVPEELCSACFMEMAMLVDRCRLAVTYQPGTLCYQPLPTRSLPTVFPALRLCTFRQP